MTGKSWAARAVRQFGVGRIILSVSQQVSLTGLNVASSAASRSSLATRPRPGDGAGSGRCGDEAQRLVPQATPSSAQGNRAKEDCPPDQPLLLLSPHCPVVGSRVAMPESWHPATLNASDESEHDSRGEAAASS